MYAFYPPVKVARTQRSPISGTETFGDLSRLRATNGEHSGRLLSGKSENGPSTSTSDMPVALSDATVSPAQFLSGVGEHSCWVVDENTRLLRVWDMNKPFWQHTAPRMAQIPNFSEEEGMPLFVAELGPGENSLAFCTKNGAVSSLDHSVEFVFHSEDGVISVSSFACRCDKKTVLTAAGTVEGLLLIAVKTGGERFVLHFDRLESTVAIRTTMLSTSKLKGIWWPSWFSEKLLGKGKESRRKEQVSDASTREGGSESVETASYEFTLLRFSLREEKQLWAVNVAAEIFLLDFGRDSRQSADNDTVCVVWATNISEVLRRKARVLAIDESPLHLCCLVYLIPCIEREAGLEVVTIDSHNGAVLQTLSIQSVESLIRSVTESPLHHTKIYINDDRQEVIVLSGHYCVRINNRVSVRSPCSSEDVLLLRGIETPICSSLLPDGRIVTLDSNGPVESISSIDEALINSSASGADMRQEYDSYNHPDTWRKSRFAGKCVGSLNVAMHIDGILQAVRIDAKMSLDSAVLELSENICSNVNFQEGNWARADIDMEDETMVMHVTQGLVRRQQEHRRFIIVVLLHKEIGPYLQAQTIAQLISAQESLLAMVAIRRLQNDSSYPLLGTTATDVNFEMLTPLYRQSYPAGAQQSDEGCTVENYFSLIRDAFGRELCQRLLREAIISVANFVRNGCSLSQPLKSRASAAEVVFGDPGRLGMLLKALGEHLCETQRSVLVDHRTKFEEALAVATIFVLVTRAIVESRNDMKLIYTVPSNVRTMLWTSSELEQYGIQLQMTSVCTTLSKALANAVATSALPSASICSAAASLLDVPTVDQLRLLDIITLLIHFLFQNHSQGSSHFYSDIMRFTLFCEPFLREPLGYPFGYPSYSADPVIGAAVLHICEELALEFNVGEILVAICLAKPVADPLQEIESYKLLGVYCQRNPHMCEFAFRTLLLQRREWELQLLPDLLPDYAPAKLARDEFLEKEVPQLAWLVKPTAFEALTAEGVRALPYITYGDDLVTHRSRCISMSKLAWVAAGGPTSTAYHAMRLDEAIVTAQKACLLPETKNAELGPAEVVQSLIKQSSVDSWVHAAKVAGLVRDTLSEDLLTQVIRRAKMHDGEVLYQIMQEGTSELEMARALEETAIGRILIAVVDQQGLQTISSLWSNVLESKEQNLLLSWIQMRNAGLVA